MLLYTAVQAAALPMSAGALLSCRLLQHACNRTMRSHSVQSASQAWWATIRPASRLIAQQSLLLY